MACLANPPCSNLPGQGQYDITRLASPDLTTNATRNWDLHDSASVSGESVASNRSSCSDPDPTEQMLRCLRNYKKLALGPLDEASTKQAMFWCCLGLSFTTATAPHSQLSAESRSGSNGSIATVSDSGFAPSVEIQPRHSSLCITDPGIEHMMTNLVAGLAALCVSGPMDLVNRSCRVPTEARHQFHSTLANLGFMKEDDVDVILLTIKTAARLLNLIQAEFENQNSRIANYWELCLKLVEALIRGDTSQANELSHNLEKRTPPPSLTEPALSALVRRRDGVPFPMTESVHAPHRILRQTRSRATSYMSRSSLSSARSLGNVPSKSSATISLSRDMSFSHSPTEDFSPAGSFVVNSGRGSMESLSRALNKHLPPQRSSTNPTVPVLSRSLSDRPKPNDKGKGKGTAIGVRPGAEGVSAQTGTRFAVTCPPSPHHRSQEPLPKLDPVLAALERGSKLQSRSTCLNCGKKGSNYPCCPRCGEAWCSRVCRVEANNGGKHVCKRSAVAGPSGLQRTI